MTLRVYVAAPSSDIPRAEKVIAALKAADIEVTHDWTVPMREHGADHQVPDEILLPCLRDDMRLGVQRADQVLVLAGPSMGAHVELGGAYLAGKVIHVAGDVTKFPWLRALGNVFWLTDEEAVDALASIAPRIAQGR